MNDKPVTVVVDDRGNNDECGHRERIALEIDADGDLRFSMDAEHDEVWIHPEALVAALRRLEVLPKTDTLRRRDGSETPSDRVRESWRRAAATDENERPAIDAHTTHRRIKNRAAEFQAERERRAAARRAEGQRFYRDADGDVWREMPGGELIIHQYGGEGTPVENAEPAARARIVQQWGPLVEVPAQTHVTARPSLAAYAQQLAAQYQQMRRDLPLSDGSMHRSVWRNF